MTAAEERIGRELLRLAREVVGPDAPPPSPGEPLAGRLDSLQLLTLVVAIEDRFQLALTDDDAAAARTLEDVVRLVAARISPAGLPADLPAAGAVEGR